MHMPAGCPARRDRGGGSFLGDGDVGTGATGLEPATSGVTGLSTDTTIGDD